MKKTLLAAVAALGALIPLGSQADTRVPGTNWILAEQENFCSAHITYWAPEQPRIFISVHYGKNNVWGLSITDDALASTGFYSKRDQRVYFKFSNGSRGYADMTLENGILSYYNLKEIFIADFVRSQSVNISTERGTLSKLSLAGSAAAIKSLITCAKKSNSLYEILL